MRHIAFLYRLRRLFSGASRQLDEPAAAASAEARLKQPRQPMSDLELARAIRQVQRMSLSEASLKKAAARLDDADRFAATKPQAET